MIYIVILSLILKNWYCFLIAISNCFMFVPVFILGHTLPVYRTSATILINETEDRPFGR